MHRKGLRATVGGVDLDVPTGAWTGGQFLRYNAGTGVIDSAAGGGGGGITGPGTTVVGNVVSWNSTTGAVVADAGYLASDVLHTSGGTLAGDVTGSPAATTVVKWQGRAVSAAAPTTGHVFVWSVGAATWSPTALNRDLAPDGVTLGGYLVTGVQGVPVTITSLTSGDILKYNGAAYVNTPDKVGDVVGPASVTATGNIAAYNGTTGKIILDSTIVVGSVIRNAAFGVGASVVGNIPTFTNTTGNGAADSGVAIASLKPSLVCRKTASQTLTTLANVTDMVLAIPSAGTWYFEFSFFSQNSTGTATSTFAVTYSGTQTALSAGMLHALSATTVGSVVTLTGAVSLATGVRTLAAVNMVTTITGTIVATSAGNLQLQFSSSLATFTIQANGGGFAQKA